jgi:hypothetical protein
MPARIVITDDGDEQVFIHFDGELIATPNHEADGWSGMTRIIDAVEKMAEHMGIRVDNQQDIV